MIYQLIFTRREGIYVILLYYGLVTTGVYAYLNSVPKFIYPAIVEACKL